MEILKLFGLTAAASITLLTVTFVVARIRNRYDLVDVIWGVAFIVIAITSYLLRTDIQIFSIQTLTTGLVVIWGLRLAIHIFTRWSRSADEDRRYADMRREYAGLPGGVAVNMFARVYVVQALIALAVSSSVVIINSATITDFGVLAGLGLGVWVIGFYFEAVGDAQLRKHLATPGKKSQLMMSGLWKFTRHPNYFGEMTQWWGIFIIALSVPFWWVSIIGPIVITVLLLFISGVPLTEKHFEGRPGWEEYKRRTSKVFPLPPRT